MFATAISILFTVLIVLAEHSLSANINTLLINGTLTNGTVPDVQMQENHIHSNNAVYHPSGHSLSKRQSYVGCSLEKQTQIDDAIKMAKRYAKDSFNHLRSNPIGSDLYTKWFGVFHPERFKQAQDTFSFYENDADKLGIMNLCPRFWKATSEFKGFTLIRGGTYYTDIHGALEHTVTIREALDLANFPDEAITNL
ncbi:putative peptidyl-lys metalloendopeptidase, partial [Rhizoctonia solani 123E]